MQSRRRPRRRRRPAAPAAAPAQGSKFSRARIYIGRDIQAPAAARTIRSDSRPGQGVLAQALEEAFASRFDFVDGALGAERTAP